MYKLHLLHIPDTILLCSVVVLDPELLFFRLSGNLFELASGLLS
jgi:hypothetical protein